MGAFLADRHVTSFTGTVATSAGLRAAFKTLASERVFDGMVAVVRLMGTNLHRVRRSVRRDCVDLGSRRNGDLLSGLFVGSNQHMKDTP